ncbi:hypothetical protein [Ruegeria arenilitoris]|uniref:hypothetical protein n=1 Tax=Ruegeria arenilitoris TaxID=1173585 RepID=UPI00147D725F|nr:hypothetical protein [Ruegeria arenilitoris]
MLDDLLRKETRTVELPFELHAMLTGAAEVHGKTVAELIEAQYKTLAKIEDALESYYKDAIDIASDEEFEVIDDV